jgi:hypothetical protein
VRLLAIIGFVASAALSLGQTVAVKPQQDRMGGFGPGSAYNKLWNKNAIITFNGRVTGKLVVQPFNGMMDAVSLLVKQPDNDAFEVQLGPQWFVSQMPVKINVGDNIMVTGSRVKLESRTVILAQSITVGKREIRFRDKSGNPMWVTAQMNAPAPTDPSLTGEIIDHSTTRINGVEYNVYQVDTGTGTTTIIGEPTWLSARQQMSFQVGMNVQVVGLRPPTQLAPNLFLADSMYSGGAVIVLRPPWGW